MLATDSVEWVGFPGQPIGRRHCLGRKCSTRATVKLGIGRPHSSRLFCILNRPHISVVFVNHDNNVGGRIVQSDGPILLWKIDIAVLNCQQPQPTQNRVFFCLKCLSSVKSTVGYTLFGDYSISWRWQVAVVDVLCSAACIVYTV